MRSAKKTAPATRGFQNCQRPRSQMLLTYLSRRDGSGTHSFSRSLQSVSLSTGGWGCDGEWGACIGPSLAGGSQAGSAGSRLLAMSPLQSLVGSLPPCNGAFHYSLRFSSKFTQAVYPFSSGQNPSARIT
ncbi:hypothetical protein HJG60_008316 [Phyllostomus discolor]|uniref:Uncharacterized protein n=1 Tax=Phyllostomus discolor TaxID=89673 RepID=A0A834DSM6_9CHIR|nr:hypothetical protein HJG60_008316 [Phyllostomus discolor]